jgi:hypothetical protein
MHLIIHHVVKFNDIDNTNRSFLVETFSCFTIKQISMTEFRKTGLLDITSDLTVVAPSKIGVEISFPIFTSQPYGFIDLSKVHNGLVHPMDSILHPPEFIFRNGISSAQRSSQQYLYYRDDRPFYLPLSACVYQRDKP